MTAIIEASRVGELSVVKFKLKGPMVTVSRLGDIRKVSSFGRGNVRMAKSTAKLISNILHGE